MMASAATDQRRIETSVLPLAEIESVWSRNVPGRRAVVTPSHDSSSAPRLYDRATPAAASRS